MTLRSAPPSVVAQDHPEFGIHERTPVPDAEGCGATYVERPCQASAFVRHFIQQERCGHMSGLSARS